MAADSNKQVSNPTTGFPEDPLLNTRAAAHELNLKPATLIDWRFEKKGPAYVRLGRLVRYRRSALLAFTERNTTTTVGEV